MDESFISNQVGRLYQFHDNAHVIIGNGFIVWMGQVFAVSDGTECNLIDVTNLPVDDRDKVIVFLEIQLGQSVGRCYLSKIIFNFRFSVYKFLEVFPFPVFKDCNGQNGTAFSNVRFVPFWAFTS